MDLRMRTIRLILLAVLSSAVSASAVFGQDGASVVAELGGQKVTLAELQQKEASKLLKARYDLYVAERQALDQLINDTLLDMQAKRENLTVAQLLDKHVKSQVKDPTEDEMKV
jgi:SurA N-terminal domain